MNLSLNKIEYLRNIFYQFFNDMFNMLERNYTKPLYKEYFYFARGFVEKWIKL